MNRTERRSHRRAAGGNILTPNSTLIAALESAAPGAVAARATDRLGFAHDASHYLLVPEAVVFARDATEVAALLKVSAAQRVPLTFRSGGTSLSGQATAAGVLVDTRRNFSAIEVLDNGLRIRVQPGATVRAVNVRLARYGRKLGPDPASESSCTIGGVVANNSSGMSCGIGSNTYRTLESAVLVLPSGTVLDTGAVDADDQLRLLEPAIHEGLIQLRDRIRNNADSVRRITRLFSIKNTMGYGVNSFLDHTRPIDVLLHLVVGSEGTLAFVAEATFRTVPLHAHAATALLLFPTLADATGSLPSLVECGFTTIELLDTTSLQVAQKDQAATASLRALQLDNQAALLVEHQQATAEELNDRVTASARTLADLPLVSPAELQTDATTRAALWHIRKGLYPAVAGARPSGTTALLEDIAVPVEQLLGTCSQLIDLFAKYRYDGSVIFGHAKDGNIHFLINENFDVPDNVHRYLQFTDEMVDLVLAAGGTLKAEHGTGRIMAPYVRRQYGDELYEIMGEIKRMLDPQSMLNPDVLLNETPDAHISHLKSTPTVEVEVDRCVECGYCEPSCPSKDLTTTPRRRIVLRREIARARASGQIELLNRLVDEYSYDAIDTCAVDGMCQTACPVLIDTGDLIRRLRSESAGGFEQKLWDRAAQHWNGVTRTAAFALTAAQAAPAAVPQALTAAGRALLGADVVPSWLADLPRGGARRAVRNADDPAAIYFPACVTSMFGPAQGGMGVHNAFLALCERGSVRVRIPDGIASMCCGTPWKSKGLLAGWKTMRDQVVPWLQRATAGGELPVVVDAASCTEGLRTCLEDAAITVVDAVAFVAEVVLPALPAARKLSSLVVHRTCSSTRLGLNADLLRVAAAAADEVVDPLDWNCCGFAGDRGLLHPELTATATAGEAKDVALQPSAQYASVNRTCELGMTRSTGQPYRHVLEVLEHVTRPLPPHRTTQITPGES